MTDLVTLFPRQPVPRLDVALVGGGSFDVAKPAPANFTIVVLYRGLHCPICKTPLRDLESKLEEFEKRGVAVAACSTDSKERAVESKVAWRRTRFRPRHRV